MQDLLSAYSDIPILGLSATAFRYLDNRRNMADELFDGNIASEITLGEAMVRGILTPPKYVLSVFSYKEELERYEQRIERTQSPWVRDQAEEILEALKRALEKSEGIEDLFDQYMTDRHGKYIVFCVGFDHMKEMMGKASEWFAKVNSAPHIYSVYSYDPGASQSFMDFKRDNDTEHLRLLYCIDALNEGIHVDDVSGVILLRPTISPVVYKQQIGRAMSAGKSGESVIFDIVNNISGLYSIDSLRDEMETAIEYYRYLGEGGMIVNEQFRILGQIENCRQLFKNLEETLSASWAQMFEMAKAYYEEHGDLLPSSDYTTAEGYHLGWWVVTQRRNYNAHDPILTEERIEKLNSIGMDWRTRLERFWEESYAAVKTYFELHGSLDGLRNFSEKVNHWVLDQRKKYRDGQLSEEQIQRLNAVGMIWELEDTWQPKFEAAREYYRVHGNLDIPVNYTTDSGIRLGVWYRSVRNQYREGILTQERIKELESIGINWVSVKTRTWMRYYDAAKTYYEANGNSDILAGYVTDTGLNLGSWISSQRSAYSKGKLPQEQIDLLEQIHFSWQRDDTRWEVGFSYLERYSRIYGNANAPTGYCTEEGFELGTWAGAQRTMRKRGKLSEKRIEKLNTLGFCWDPTEAMWQDGCSHAADYYKENGNLLTPANYVCEDGFKLGAWVASKRQHYQQGRLTDERIAELESIGMVWQPNANEYKWQIGYEHAKAFYEEHGNLKMPVKYVAPDGYKLANWIHGVKIRIKRGSMKPERLEQLKKIGFVQ